MLNCWCITWPVGFKSLQRHPELSVRTPEGISVPRTKTLHQKSGKFFFLTFMKLNLIKKLTVNPPAYSVLMKRRLLQLCNTGKVKLLVRGNNAMVPLTSAERGILITFITCMNANGTCVPSLCSGEKNTKGELTDAAPVVSISAWRPSGWVQTDVFAKWFERFGHFVDPSADGLFLLSADGKYWHIKNLGVLVKAGENDVAILCLWFRASVIYINLWTPNVNYSWRTAPLTSKVAFCIFIQQIYVPNILNMVYTLGFFPSSKCSLFHNSNVFGSCIIHILYTGWAKIKKIIPAPKG